MGAIGLEPEAESCQNFTTINSSVKSWISNFSTMESKTSKLTAFFGRYLSSFFQSSKMLVDSGP